MCTAPGLIAMSKLWLSSIFALTLLVSAAHADDTKPKPSQADRSAEGEIAKFCTNFAPTAAEARIAYQTKRLNEIEARVRAAVEVLEKQETAAREWVSKRDAMLKAATDDVVAVYAKMSADAAAGQLATMDETLAAGILAKLKPPVASAILAEMDADRAGRLTTLMSGGETEKKS